MSERDEAAEPEEVPLWRFLPPHEFSAPSAPARETVRVGMARFLQRFRPDDTPPPLVADDDPHGLLLEEAARERSLPPALLDERAARLAEALDEMAGRGPPVLVDPPHAGGREALEALAGVRGYRIARPPPGSALLGEPAACLAAVEIGGDEPLVLPALERFFLRTPEGLDVLRLLLERLQERTAPTLMGCGSWAWRFLEEAVEIDLALPVQLTPGPLDAARLHRWFAMPGLLCAERGGGELVGGQTGDETEPPEYLRRLAATARGSAGTARALWAEALRVPQPGDDANGNGDGNGDGDGKPADGEEAERARADLLVVPWQRLKLPDFPGKAARDDLMLLQLLLLHGGLEETVARALLPFEPARIGTRLRALAGSGLVAGKDGFWHVPPAAYPAVRRELGSAGFWTDSY